VRFEAVFLDRDGTLNVELDDWVTRPEQLALEPGAADAVARLNQAGLRVIVVTNQSAVARGFVTEENLARVHERLAELVSQGGGRLDAVYHCPHGPGSTCDCRKPLPGLLRRAADAFHLDLARTALVGDAERDLAAGRAAGCGALVLVRTGKGRHTEAALTGPDLAPSYIADDLPAAVDWILAS
jgi:D-glycero-D-manno-heptose 1,7-bisphosphate phosphatase